MAVAQVAPRALGASIAALLSGSREGLLVAMSAGVDSCTLAYLAHRALGERMLAVTLRSESSSREEIEEAVAFARRHGLPHRVVEHSELADPAYVKNDGLRCYHCRKNLAVELHRVAREAGLGRIAMGVVLDDFKEYRPGLRAATEAGIWFPFVEAGLGKADVRSLSAGLGLEVADKPSNACLSSRIALFTPVTEEKLRQVEAAERAVRELTGVAVVRVRHHGDVARIEARAEDRERVLARAGDLTAALQALGFTFVALDLLGYRSGSMTEGLMGG